MKSSVLFLLAFLPIIACSQSKDSVDFKHDLSVNVGVIGSGLLYSPPFTLAIQYRKVVSDKWKNRITLTLASKTTSPIKNLLIHETDTSYIYRDQEVTRNNYNLRLGKEYQLHQYFSAGGALLLGFQKSRSSIYDYAHKWDQTTGEHTLSTDVAAHYHDDQISFYEKHPHQGPYIKTVTKAQYLTTGIVLDLNANLRVYNRWSLSFTYGPQISYNHLINLFANENLRGPWENNEVSYLSLDHYLYLYVRYAFRKSG